MLRPYNRLFGRRDPMPRVKKIDSVGAVCEPSPRYHRRSIRLRGYDYSQVGAYFVTICTKDRECLFGEIVNGDVRMNAWGDIVRTCWDDMPRHFRDVQLDAFVVMPNHVHGILVCMRADGPTPGRHGIVGAQHAAPLRQRGAPTNDRLIPFNVVPGSLGAMMRSFKSAVTKRMNILRAAPGVPVWQRNYYERVIRDADEMNRIREYIATNPAHWAEDENNPSHVGKISPVGAQHAAPLQSI
jgi:putative transposase